MADELGRACRRSRAWHRAQWLEHVLAWEESGVSGVAYCARHGFRPRSLYRWRRVFWASGELSRASDESGALAGSAPSGGRGAEESGASPDSASLLSGRGTEGLDCVERFGQGASTAAREAGASSAPMFAEVHVAESPMRGLGASGIELVLCGERRVRVAPGFDEGTVRRVVALLESLPVESPSAESPPAESPPC